MQARNLSLLMALALIAAGGARADQDANGSCEHQDSAAPGVPAYATPEYAARADDAAVDPEQMAAENAWRDYQESVFDALSASPRPRDWALATLTRDIDFFVGDEPAQAELTALLQRAVRDAPDDALVQWIAAQRSHGDTSAKRASLQALRRLEPGNAAVLVDALNAAAHANDPAAVDRALADMSVATKFDGHYVDLQKALIEVYQRYPISTAQWVATNPESNPVPKEMAPLVSAVAVSAVAAMPPLQELVNACRVDEANGEHLARAANCASIGRLLLTQGDTLVANRIGATLLRVSHTVSADDARIVRDQDWVYQQFLARVAGWNDEQSSAEITAHLEANIDSGSEMEAMRRTVTRSGVPLVPPADWVDKYSPLFAERLQKADQAALERPANIAH